MLNSTKPTFILEEKEETLDTSKQIIEIFINNKDQIKINKSLGKFEGLPILRTDGLVSLTELEKNKKKSVSMRFSKGGNFALEVK